MTDDNQAPKSMPRRKQNTSAPTEGGSSTEPRLFDGDVARESVPAPRKPKARKSASVEAPKAGAPKADAPKADDPKPPSDAAPKAATPKPEPKAKAPKAGVPNALPDPTGGWLTVFEKAVTYYKRARAVSVLIATGAGVAIIRIASGSNEAAIIACVLVPIFLSVFLRVTKEPRNRPKWLITTLDIAYSFTIFLAFLAAIVFVFTKLLIDWPRPTRDATGEHPTPTQPSAPAQDKTTTADPAWPSSDNGHPYLVVNISRRKDPAFFIANRAPVTAARNLRCEMTLYDISQKDPANPKCRLNLSPASEPLSIVPAQKSAEMAISQHSQQWRLTKPGDTFFGTITINCDNCAGEQTYWARISRDAEDGDVWPRREPEADQQAILHTALCDAVPFDVNQYFTNRGGLPAAMFAVREPAVEDPLLKPFNPDGHSTWDGHGWRPTKAGDENNGPNTVVFDSGALGAEGDLDPALTVVLPNDQVPQMNSWFQSFRDRQRRESPTLRFQLRDNGKLDFDAQGNGKMDVALEINNDGLGGAFKVQPSYVLGLAGIENRHLLLRELLLHQIAQCRTPSMPQQPHYQDEIDSGHRIAIPVPITIARGTKALDPTGSTPMIATIAGCASYTDGKGTRKQAGFIGLIHRNDPNAREPEIWTIKDGATETMVNAADGPEQKFLDQFMNKPKSL